MVIKKKTIVLFGGFERDQNNVQQITVTALDHSKMECQINNLKCNLLKYLSWKQTTEGIFLRFQSQGIKFPQTFFLTKNTISNRKPTQILSSNFLNMCIGKEINYIDKCLLNKFSLFRMAHPVL